jgi:hypothetical protein
MSRAETSSMSMIPYPVTKGASAGRSKWLSGNDSPSIDIEGPGNSTSSAIVWARSSALVTRTSYRRPMLGPRALAAGDLLAGPLDGSDTRVRLSIGTWHLTEGSS